MEEQQPYRLKMYIKATKVKQVIRHIIPNVPFPIPVTITAFLSGVVLLIALTKLNIFDVFSRLFVFVTAISIFTYLEPKNIHPFAWLYAIIRKKTRPVRRVVNRSVPRKGWVKEYKQQTIVWK